MSAEDPIHSTGRGGAGNIGPDPGVYTAGDIVREGQTDDTSQPHSSGRGGAGNISTAGTHDAGSTSHDDRSHQHHLSSLLHRDHGHGNGHETSTAKGSQQQQQQNAAAGAAAAGTAGPASADYIPETATRTVGQEGYDNFHTGRGGEGNIHRDRYGGHSGPTVPPSTSSSASAAPAPGAKGKHGSTGESLKEKAKHAMGLDHHGGKQ